MATAAEDTCADGARAELRNHDKYCWYCHEICSKHHCSTCFRAYHDKCLRSAEKKHCLKGDVLMCPVCLSLKQSEEFFIGKQSILTKLKHVKDEIMTHVPFNVLSHLPDWTESQYMPKIVNPINLKDIFDKIDNRLYKSLDAFLTDIDCMVHNCKLDYGKGHNITEIAFDLIDFCKFECQCISACINCYESYYSRGETEWRTRACTVPHLILWAKLDRSSEFWPAKKGFTYWPAKLLAVKDGIATVIFFGDSKFDDVCAQSCHLYSSIAPNSMIETSAKDKDMASSLKEVELYIENAKKVFGPVDTNFPKTSFDQRRIDEHMKAMFPEYKGQDNVVEEAGNDTEYAENIGANNGERPAKRPRFSRQETVTQVHGIDEISETMVKLHKLIENLNGSNKQKVDDLKDELERSETKYAGCQAKIHELQRQLDDASLKQTELKNEIAANKVVHKNQVNIAIKNQAEEVNQLKRCHERKITDIKTAHSKEIAEVNAFHENNTKDLKTKFQSNEAIIVKMQEQIAKQENQLKITTNFLEKATRKVDELKKCTGCEKLLDGLCRACDTVWADLSSTKIEPSNESLDETSTQADNV